MSITLVAGEMDIDALAGKLRLAAAVGPGADLSLSATHCRAIASRLDAGAQVGASLAQVKTAQDIAARADRALRDAHRLCVAGVIMFGGGCAALVVALAVLS